MMIADAMVLFLEPEPGWEITVLDAEQAAVEKAKALAEYREEGAITETHWVEPRFMTEAEIRNNPRFADIYSRSSDAAVFSQPDRAGIAVCLPASSDSGPTAAGATRTAGLLHTGLGLNVFIPSHRGGYTVAR